jgi:DNA-binding NarL/FixJ family response regulator
VETKIGRRAGQSRATLTPKPKHARKARPAKHLPQGGPDLAPPKLTLKQRQLLELMLRGESDKEMASQLNVTYSAIRKRIEGLFRKFKARNKAEVSGHILRLGFLGYWLFHHWRKHPLQGPPAP